MRALAYAKSYRDLMVYQKARALAQEIFIISRGFPIEETYSLTDQIRRSSRSVGAQIAEAWAKCRYEKHFISKLTDADGEQQETQHWLETAFDCGYINSAQKADLIAKYIEIGRLLGGMMAKAELFCNPESLSIHEERAEYFTDSYSAQQHPNTDH